jgi:hypothetical protein
LQNSHRHLAVPTAPVEHDPIEAVGILDIRKMACAFNRQKLATLDRCGDHPVLHRIGARIVRSAQHQRRRGDLRQARRPFEGLDRGGAADIALWRCCGDSVVNLLPENRIARFEAGAEPAPHRRFGERRHRVCCLNDERAAAPAFLGVLRRLGLRVAQDQGRDAMRVKDAEALTDHAADRKPAEMNLGDREIVEDRHRVLDQLLHGVVAGRRIAAAMAAHIHP